MSLLDDLTGKRTANDDGRDGRPAERGESGRTTNRGDKTTADANAGGRGRTDRNSDGTATGRDGEHVCAFCRATFDASRGDCPECSARIVLRGER
ncbi:MULTISPECIES: hypothetical protein [Halorussus]|uniref:hypothetical protein n=1 Tax=Halorussus TaxID=1070314 RepID=UPI0020A16FF8|nr:hypothetical protein [Halorussus vallis]USZ78143.1 hypothetical protein NGM07_21020 [Halorussus vallis]